MKSSTNSIITFFFLVYFVTRTHGIAGYIQSFWVLPLLIIFIFSIVILFKFSKSDLRIIAKESVWILMSFFILLIYIFFGDGNFKLFETFKYLVFSVPFYIIGYFWGLKGHDKNFRNTVVGYFIFILLYLFTKFLQLDSINRISKDTLGRLFYVPGKFSYNDLIFFWPLISFVFILAFILFLEHNRSRPKRFFLFTVSIIYLIAFFLSGLASSIFLIFSTLIIYYFIKIGSKGQIKLLLIFPIIIMISYLGIYLIGSGKLGTFGTLTSKTKGIISLINSGKLYDENLFNTITSDRWTAGRYSFHQFFEKPLFGQGAYLEGVKGDLGNIKSYTGAAGGHSFILDSLAYYGIWGLTMVMILVKFSKDAWKYFRVSSQHDRKAAMVFTSLIISLLISNILNSSFLASYFDNFVFLCSGFYLGKYIMIKHAKLL